jgi:heptosyltransferase-1
VKQHPQKVLIVKPSSLGDIVHSLPFLDAFHRTYPDAELHWVVARGFEGLLEGHPFLKRVWIIHKDEWKKIGSIGKTVLEMQRFFRDLRGAGFDLAVDLQGLFRSGVITWATGAPLRIGFKEAREGSTVFYTRTVDVGSDVHAVERSLKVASFLGCEVGKITFTLPSREESSPKTIPFSYPPCGEYGVIIPGARKPSKRWPAGRFGRVASMLPLNTVVIGSRGDAKLAAEVVSASGGKASSIAGKTDLRGATEVIRCARFVLCNDTGPMHIAAALGVYVFALFGSSDPVETGPYTDRCTVIRKELPCVPCGKRSCKSPLCMDMIQVHEVADAVNAFLK